MNNFEQHYTVHIEGLGFANVSVNPAIRAPRAHIVRWEGKLIGVIDVGVDPYEIFAGGEAYGTAPSVVEGAARLAEVAYQSGVMTSSLN